VADAKPAVVSRSYDEQTKITQLVLSNGVILLLFSLFSITLKPRVE